MIEDIVEALARQAGFTVNQVDVLQTKLERLVLAAMAFERDLCADLAYRAVCRDPHEYPMRIASKIRGRGEK